MTNEFVYRLVLAKRDGQPPLIPVRYHGEIRTDGEVATDPFVGDWRPLWRTALSLRLKVSSISEQGPLPLPHHRPARAERKPATLF